jgi:hypothetical protein
MFNLNQSFATVNPSVVYIIKDLQPNRFPWLYVNKVVLKLKVLACLPSMYNAVLSGRLQLAKISEARTKSQL